MPRAIVTANRVYPFVIVLTFIVSIMPAQALGWTKFPAEVLGIFLNPFAEKGNVLASWLRPPPASSLIGGMTRADIDKLLMDKAIAEQQLRAERDKIEALQSQLAQLQKIPIDVSGSGVNPIIAPIGLRSPTSAVGTVKLGRGSNHGVRPGCIAVYDGDQLLGRVTEDVAARQCELRPLVNADTGKFAGSVLAKYRGGASGIRSKPMWLEPRGDGTFTAQGDKVDVIGEGDEVVLNDDQWPESAQGMMIGVIERVFTNDLEPLRNTVVVRPRLLVSQVAFVVLKVEQKVEEGAAPSKGPRK